MKDKTVGTKVCVGRSGHRGNEEAGLDAAAEARRALQGAPCSCALVFATAGYDQQPLIDAIVETLRPAELVGCSGEGVISSLGSYEGTHGVVVVAIASDVLQFKAVASTSLGDDSAEAGKEIAAKLAVLDEPLTVLVFADGLTGDIGALLRVMQAELPKGATLCGGTAGELLRFERTYQYFQGSVLTQSVVALGISGGHTEVVLSHGCDLVGPDHRITEVTDGMVRGVDDRDAWAVLSEYLPEETIEQGPLAVTDIVLAAPLDETHADNEDQWASEDVIIRVPVRRDEKGLYFAAGIREGMPFRFALRNPDKVVKSAVEAVSKLRDRSRISPCLILQLDCAGRGRLLFGDRARERVVAPVTQAYPDVPYAGLHTYGEIAQAGGRVRFHNYTAVLCAIYDKGHDES